MTRPFSRCAAPALLLGLSLVGACSNRSPRLTESEIPGYRTIDIDYDEARLRVSADLPLTDDEKNIVLSVSRAAMARYIEARSPQAEAPVDGRFHGQLSLHRGWRQEFFPLARELYEGTARLPAGVLYADPSPSGVARDVEYGWLVRGRADRFTGVFTNVVEVQSDGVYTFGMNTDDGSIGTLQNLTDDVEELRVLWYEWQLRAMTVEPTEISVPLTAGTYLLTVHYFEQGGVARYQLFVSRRFDGEGAAQSATVEGP